MCLSLVLGVYIKNHLALKQHKVLYKCVWLKKKKINVTFYFEWLFFYAFKEVFYFKHGVYL